MVYVKLLTSYVPVPLSGTLSPYRYKAALCDIMVISLHSTNVSLLKCSQVQRSHQVSDRMEQLPVVHHGIVVYRYDELREPQSE
jgi:hypothetical protein